MAIKIRSPTINKINSVFDKQNTPGGQILRAKRGILYPYIVYKCSDSTIKSEHLVLNSQMISVTCPHCKDTTMIENKLIPFSLFHHMVYKKNNRQVPPDMDQTVYEDLIKRKQVIGCYQPYFVYKQDDNSLTTIKCTYMSYNLQLTTKHS